MPPPSPKRIRIPIGAELRRRSEDLSRLLEAAGALLVASSQRAFARKRFGPTRWPEQYEGQEEPFLHVAGALGDLQTGARIKERRFRRGPALEETGTLEDSVDHAQVSPDTVRVGTVVPYAAIHQFGLKVTQRITPQMRENLTRIRRRQVGRIERSSFVGRPFKGRRRESRSGPGQPEAGPLTRRLQAIDKLGFIHQLDEVGTQVAERPFLGLEDETKDKLRRLVKVYFETGRTRI